MKINELVESLWDKGVEVVFEDPYFHIEGIAYLTKSRAEATAFLTGVLAGSKLRETTKSQVLDLLFTLEKSEICLCCDRRWPEHDAVCVVPTLIRKYT